MSNVMIKVKKGTFNLSAPRSDLLEVSETHDGVAFSFRGGLQLYFTAPYMPQEVKHLMNLSSGKYDQKNLIFDLDDVKFPVKIDIT
jgi:hypothetical protein